MTSNKVCQFLSESGGNNFTESAPRPPVPGEENEIVSNGGMSTRSSESMKSHVSTKSSKSQTSIKSTASNRDLTHSPAATPRRSAKDKSFLLSGCDTEEAPLGFEPEGSDSNSPPFHENMENSFTPPFMRWAENLTYLLDDRDGLSLFTTFLDQEGFGKNYVEFYFACEGLKKSEPIKVPQIIKIINRKYFKSDKLPCVTEQTKCAIQEKIKKQAVDRTIFDGAQLEVRNEMSCHSYPLFIKSDLYVQYIQKGGDSPNSNSSSGSNSARPLSMPLPTLPEDKMLSDISTGNAATVCGPPSSSKRPPSAKRTIEAFNSTRWAILKAGAWIFLNLAFRCFCMNLDLSRSFLLSKCLWNMLKSRSHTHWPYWAGRNLVDKCALKSGVVSFLNKLDLKAFKICELTGLVSVQRVECWFYHICYLWYRDCTLCSPQCFKRNQRTTK